MELLEIELFDHLIVLDVWISETKLDDFYH